MLQDHTSFLLTLQTLVQIPQGVAEPKSRWSEAPMPACVNAAAATTVTTAVSVYAGVHVEMVTMIAQMEQNFWQNVDRYTLGPGASLTSAAFLEKGQAAVLRACLLGLLWPPSCCFQDHGHDCFTVGGINQPQVTAAPSICSWLQQLLNTGCHARQQVGRVRVRSWYSKGPFIGKCLTHVVGTLQGHCKESRIWHSLMHITGVQKTILITALAT